MPISQDTIAAIRALIDEMRVHGLGGAAGFKVQRWANALELWLTKLTEAN